MKLHQSTTSKCQHISSFIIQSINQSISLYFSRKPIEQTTKKNANTGNRTEQTHRRIQVKNQD